MCGSLVLLLDAAGIDTFSQLHVLPGQQQGTYMMDHLTGPKARAKAIVVLLSRAFFRSMPVLEEVYMAITKNLRVIAIRLETLPPDFDQWRTDMWSDRLEGESQAGHIHRVTVTHQRVQCVKRFISQTSLTPSSGLFGDLVDMELPHLIKSLVDLGDVGPVKVFASMRFRNGAPLPEAVQLREALLNYGIDLVIVRVTAGDSIDATVFHDTMADCVAFVAFGSVDYGEDTGCNANSHLEVKQWYEHHALAWGPIIPVNLNGEGEEFAYETGRTVFRKDALQLKWTETSKEGVATGVAHAVSQRTQNHSSMHSGGAVNVDRMVEQAKAFLWRMERRRSSMQSDFEF